jgi:hypothetical protein
LLRLVAGGAGRPIFIVSTGELHAGKARRTTVIPSTDTADSILGPSPWELTVYADKTTASGSLAVGDLDGDGKIEVVTGGSPGLFWVRVGTFEHGTICLRDTVDKNGFHVGVGLCDFNNDGKMEVVAGNNPPTSLWWFQAGEDISKPWQGHLIDDKLTGAPHDVLFADVDGDGEQELVCNAMYCSTPGLFIYKPGADSTKPWKKHQVQDGMHTEGTSVADVDGDGIMEIVLGPHLYRAPSGGAYAGLWKCTELATGFREFCRTAFVDITGNGKPDLVIAESEYPDGRISWLENPGTGKAWVEHALDRTVNFSHTLWAWRDDRAKVAHVFAAEMAKGGWDAPYNFEARLLHYTTADKGRSWQYEEIYRGAGTHEADAFDIEGDTFRVAGKPCDHTHVQIWERPGKPSPLNRFRHRFVDRQKPNTATDILAVDVDGDGRQDIVCGAWWYRNPSWERRTIPGIYQAINALDIDGDGRAEIIATKRREGEKSWYPALSSDLYWLKAVDPLKGKWEEHHIGVGDGQWPHGTFVGRILPADGLALVCGYHGPGGRFPEVFEAPADPTQPWPKRILAEVAYGEEIVGCDMTGSGTTDLVAGHHWLENMGDGTFTVHTVGEGDLKTARVRVADVNGNGRMDIIVVEEDLSYEKQESYCRVVAWLENPGDPRVTPWPLHVIDRVRCPHSLDVADLDGDGELEVIVGEHDPFKPERSRSRLLVYKKAEPNGRAWKRFVLDDRFEHHDGAKIIELDKGRLGIMSHGWAEGQWVHLWEPA